MTRRVFRVLGVLQDAIQRIVRANGRRVGQIRLHRPFNPNQHTAMIKPHVAFGVLMTLLLLMGWSTCSGDSVVNEPATVNPPMPPSGPATVSADVAFINVNIVPMDADRVLESQTVLVKREGIVQIGPTDQVAIPDSAMRIDGTGKYLLPGLSDMHVHWTANTTSELRNDNFLFLANGVTTIRVMWGSRSIDAMRLSKALRWDRRSTSPVPAWTAPAAPGTQRP